VVEVVLFGGASLIPRASELHRDSPDAWEALTRGPLCKRHSADTRFIMNQAGDPRLSQLTLEQFVVNSMKGLRRLSC
jgi:hypothetical protein